MTTNPRQNCPLMVNTEEVKAITDPLYKAGISVLIRHGIVKIEEESK